VIDESDLQDEKLFDPSGKLAWSPSWKCRTTHVITFRLAHSGCLISSRLKRKWAGISSVILTASTRKLSIYSEASPTLVASMVTPEYVLKRGSLSIMCPNGLFSSELWTNMLDKCPELRYRPRRPVPIRLGDGFKKLPNLNRCQNRESLLWCAIEKFWVLLEVALHCSFVCTKNSSNDGIRDARAVVDPKDSTSMRTLKTEICGIGKHFIHLESLEDWKFDRASERVPIDFLGWGESPAPGCHDRWSDDGFIQTDLLRQGQNGERKRKHVWLNSNACSMSNGSIGPGFSCLVSRYWRDWSRTVSEILRES
jgi:hypothetical protein